MAKKNYFKKGRFAAGKYKSTSAYLRAIYKANKDQIDLVFDENINNKRSLGGPKSPYKMFKMELLQQGEKINQISISDMKARVAALSRTQLYSREQQSVENLRSALSKDKFSLDIIRKQVGWKKKLDWSNVKYHGDPMDKENRYYYFEDTDGSILSAFKLGDDYKNKKKVTVVYVDPNGDVISQFSELDIYETRGEQEYVKGKR